MEQLAIISDAVHQETAAQQGNVYGWNERKIPYLGSFHILVVDTRIASPVGSKGKGFQDPVRLNEQVDTNINKIKDFRQKIKAGCILIFLVSRMREVLGFKNTNLSAIEACLEISDVKSARMIEVDEGRGIELLTQKPPFRRYFEYIEFFNVIIPGKIDQIAVTAGSKETIAGSFSVGNGSVIILPHYTQGSKYSGSKETWDDLLRIFQDTGELFYKEIEESPEPQMNPPDWVKKYKSEAEREVEKKYSEAKEELARFRLMNQLLWGGGGSEMGKNLVEAVKNAFTDLGLSVEKTMTGATVDLTAVEKETGKKFAIEVTGTKNKINTRHKKAAQVFDFVLNEKEDEKVILVANTYKDVDPEERNLGFTERLIENAKNNEVCLMNSTDLFFIWKNVFEKKEDVADVIEHLQNTNGLFRL